MLLFIPTFKSVGRFPVTQERENNFLEESNLYIFKTKKEKECLSQLCVERMSLP